MNPSTSNLVANLVDGVIGDNKLAADDPILNYLVGDEGWDGRDDSDVDSQGFASDDSDIEVLIEEHILLEKLKQVRGDTPKVGGEDAKKENNEANTNISEMGKTITDLYCLKLNVEEAMQLNLQMREDLLSLENKLVQVYREACDWKTEQMRKTRIVESRLRLMSQAEMSPGRFIDNFRAPYFKLEGSAPPWNEDAEKLSVTNLPLISRNDDWSYKDIYSLGYSVRKFLIQEQCCKEKLLNKMKRGKSATADEVKRLRMAPLYELVKARLDDSFDWKQISSAMDRPTTARECRVMWSLYVKPSLKQWTKTEDKKLVDIAKASAFQDWDKIAVELNTGRTSYECFHHHQATLCLEWQSGKWTKDEEEYLGVIIEKCKIGGVISWDKVSYCLDSKSIDQIYAKWHGFQAPYIHKGRFSEYEDRILLSMIHKFGADLRSVKAVLKNRSLAQLTARYKNHLLPQIDRIKVGEWTAREDKRLLELVKEYGEAKWALIAKQIKTRSRIQIRHRYSILKKKLTHNPNLNLTQIHRPKRSNFRERANKNKLFFNKVIAKKGSIKNLLYGNDLQNVKPKLKNIDKRLTQYFQAKYLKENVDESEFYERLKNRDTTGNTLESFQDKVGDNKTLLSTLLFSSIALRNIQEVNLRDDWSQRDKLPFYKSILEMYMRTKGDKPDDLYEWHKYFCSIFAAPVLLAHLDIEKWKGFLDGDADGVDSSEQGGSGTKQTT